MHRCRTPCRCLMHTSLPGATNSARDTDADRKNWQKIVGLFAGIFWLSKYKQWANWGEVDQELEYEYLQIACGHYSILTLWSSNSKCECQSPTKRSHVMLLWYHLWSVDKSCGETCCFLKINSFWISNCARQLHWMKKIQEDPKLGMTWDLAQTTQLTMEQVVKLI